MTPLRRLRTAGRIFVGLLGLLGPVPAALGQGQVAEPQLKAAFVLNFVRYVEWPEAVFPARDAPIVLCMVGREDGTIALAALDGRKAQERVIKVRFEVAIENARACQVVFIAEAEARRIPAAIRSLQALPVLTISDAEGFIDQGGAIGIVHGEQRLQFEINRTALDRAQLKASSQLLKLARAVLSPGS